MIYLGIDPGPVTSTAVVFDGLAVLAVKELDVLSLAEWAVGFSNATIACEWIASYGMPVGREVFETVHAIGYLTAIVGEDGLRLIPRLDIKLHLCKSPRAKDASVRQALIDRVGKVGTKKAPGPCYGVSKHAWAALAVAVTAFDLPVTDHEATFHRRVAG